MTVAVEGITLDFKDRMAGGVTIFKKMLLIISVGVISIFSSIAQ